MERYNSDNEAESYSTFHLLHKVKLSVRHRCTSRIMSSANNKIHHSPTEVDNPNVTFVPTLCLTGGTITTQTKGGDKNCISHYLEEEYSLLALQVNVKKVGCIRTHPLEEVFFLIQHLLSQAYKQSNQAFTHSQSIKAKYFLHSSGKATKENLGGEM